MRAKKQVTLELEDDEVNALRLAMCVVGQVRNESVKRQQGVYGYGVAELKFIDEFCDKLMQAL